MKHLLALLCLALLSAPALLVADTSVQFNGRVFKLAFVKVASDGSVLNEYVPEGETLDGWTLLLALRYYPHAQKIGEPATEWVRMVRPLLTRDIEPIGKKDVPNAMLLDAWLCAPDKTYIEVNYYLFRQEDGVPGVKAYQFAQKIMLNAAGRTDVTKIIKRRGADYDELFSLRLPILKGKIPSQGSGH